MRIIASFCKCDEVRFVSHLDMQRLFQRAFRRAGLPLAYSKGFNPHPLLSFATALSVGYTSSGEYFDVMLTENVLTDEFIERVNSVLPEGVKIESAVDAGEFKTSLTTLMRSADYTVTLNFSCEIDKKMLEAAVEELLSGEIVVMKKTKGGIKPIDIRPMLLGVSIVHVEDRIAVVKIKGKLTAEGGLPLELLLGVLYEKIGTTAISAINRDKIEMNWESIG